MKTLLLAIALFAAGIASADVNAFAVSGPQGATIQYTARSAAVTDKDTPLDANGNPLYAPVWRAMAGVQR